MSRCAAIAALIALSGAACDSPVPAARRHGANTEAAYCHARVNGTGEVAVEREYLPRVVACENGAAGYEALKAQAIAARSYLYYRLDRTGSIADGTRDQVFSCGREPTEEHRQAVRDTAYQVLSHRGRQVAGFFVAGARPRHARCTGGRDTTRTERYVTYNGERSGRAVRKTRLGANHPANRGAMSQNGADCLAQRGWDASQILRFYYGADVEVSRADDTACRSSDEPMIAGWGGDRGIALASFGLALAIAMAARTSRVRRPRKRRCTRR